MATERLDPQRTCLLFFDTCNYFVNGPSLRPENRSTTVAASVRNWVRLREAARKLKMAVVYSAAAYRPDGSDWYAHITDQLIAMPLFYDMEVSLVADRVQNATPLLLPGTSQIWNGQEWDVR